MFKGRFFRWVCPALMVCLISACSPGNMGTLAAPSTAATVTPSQPTALYTPVVVLPPGTTMPATFIPVDLSELLSNPEQYAGKFVEVVGQNRLAYTRPACYPYVGPPTEWLLGGPSGSIEVHGPSSEVYSSPTGPDGRWIRDIVHKQLAVRGWVRLWEGPQGCGYRNAQGTVIPQEPIKRVWYIDVVQAQYMESVEPQRTK